jgi:IS5 family transposase
LQALDHYKKLIIKHIDLLDRRIIQGEKIPHEEKLFSIFEPYTERVNKGKRRPSVELGKKVSITTDQFHLIVD